MARLDIERQVKLEPLRMQTALDSFESLEVEGLNHSDKVITFFWKGSVIQYFPYSGWASGKTIKDGRGLKKLLKQLERCAND